MPVYIANSPALPISGGVGKLEFIAPALLSWSINSTEASLICWNKGGAGGATFRFIDDVSGADWKFKATGFGGFKIRDQAAAVDVLTFEHAGAGALNAIYVTAAGNVGIGSTTPLSKLKITGLPTAAAGLAAGDVWVDTTGGLNILKIV
jgi:hypothetical protein